MWRNRLNTENMKKYVIIRWVCVAVFCSGSVCAEKVKILLMGDTQYVLNTNPQYGDPENFLDTMAKITTDPVTKDADFLIHMGDIIETGRGNDIPASYIYARKGFDSLKKGGMPYVLNFGNNDNGSDYNHTFPIGDYKSWPSFVDHYEGHLNVAHHFEAGGVDWLVISIRFKADGDTGLTAWAKSLIEAHPEKRVILVAHDQYMSSKEIGEMARKFPNTVLFCAGHNASGVEMMQGRDGHPIGYIRTCWHNKDLDSYLCEVEIDTVAGTVSSRYYSPYWEDFGDDPESLLYRSKKNPSGTGAKNQYQHPWIWKGFDFKRID